jgi:hypothetical protein
MSETIDISKLNKAEVLAVLYNASRPLGMGFLQYNPAPMTKEQAEELLKDGTYFDYLKGRVMKVDIQDQLDPWGYDRYNGTGAAASAIEALIKTGDTDAQEIVNQHNKGKLAAAHITRKSMGETSKIRTDGSTAVYSIGLNDMAHVLAPALDEGDWD